jgi:ATP-dependent DNA ligase
MTASIPLAKNFDISKLEFPVYVSQKHDGVPVRIDLAPDRGGVLIGTQSRSGKPLPSVDLLVNDFVNALAANGMTFSRPMTFVAEITHTYYTDFKDVGGVVRKKEPQDNLVLNFFDFSLQGEEGDLFFHRTQVLCNMLDSIRDPRFLYVGQTRITSKEVLARLAEAPAPDGVEGYIVRSFNAPWKPNTRHWDYQKIVQDPTVDLKIVGFEEAIDKHGERKGMVGGLIAEYRGEKIGIGPGKMTHAERQKRWEFHSGVSTPVEGYFGIACIKYKRDDSYTALRQPTFQHWRTDRDDTSEET